MMQRKRRETTTTTTTMTTTMTTANLTSETGQQMTNEIVCNSRCKCLQVKLFLRNKTRGDGEGKEEDKKDGKQTISDHHEQSLDERERLNQIALIEFGQDYSFDDEPTLASSSSSSSASFGQEDELNVIVSSSAAADDRASSWPNAISGSQDADEQTGSQSGGFLWFQPAPQPQTVAQIASGSGDQRASVALASTIKLSAGSSKTGDQSRVVSTANQQHQRQRVMMDQLASSRSSFNYNSSSQAPPTPLNGHALLLPSFKKQSPSASSPLKLNSFASFFESLKASSSHSKQQEPQQDTFVVVENMAPLKALDLSQKQLGDLTLDRQLLNQQHETNLTQLISRALIDLHIEPVQSLVLRNNNIKFELWTQLYALLLESMRNRLEHLDLSHNSLIKLGVTFTGYIEHQLAYQLMRSNGTNQAWPFAATSTLLVKGGARNNLSSNSLSNSTSDQSMSNYLKLLNQFKMSSSSTSALPASSSLGAVNANSKRLFRRPNLGDGHLFDAIRLEQPLNLSQPEEAQEEDENKKNEPFESSILSLAHNSNVTRQPLIKMMLHRTSQIKALDLSHNKLRWLINDQFRVLKRVQVIRLDHNRIRFIHSRAFNGLTELKYLNLNYNRLQTIYMEQFQTNPNLLALFLKANYLTYLRAGSLATQTHLKRLDLSRNKFTILSNNAFVGLDSLEYLNLSSNSFVHVPSASFHPLVSSLKQLDMSDNQLTQLMPGAFFHLQLEQIWLNDNDQLVSIDRGAFWDLPHLNHLALQSNSQLMNVNQQSFVGVPKLKMIQVDDCPLLDTRTRQLLENITQANTMRTILKQQQLSEANVGTSSSSKEVANNKTTIQVEPQLNASNISATQTNNDSLNMISASIIDEPVKQQQPISGGNKQSLFIDPNVYQNQYQQQMSIQLQYDQTSATQKITKYFYSLAGLMLIVVALKLVFRHSSTRHYLNSRRRRRRVYQTNSNSSTQHSSESLSLSSADEQASPSSTSSASPSSLTSKAGNQGGENGTFGRERQQAGRRHGASFSVSSLISSRAFSASSGSLPTIGDSFAFVERPKNVIKQRSMANLNIIECLQLVAGREQPMRGQMEPATVEPDLNEPHLNSYAPAACCCPECQPTCCDQVEARTQQAIAAYDNDELLHKLAAAAAGLCDLEQVNCSHCYESAMQYSTSTTLTTAASATATTTTTSIEVPNCYETTREDENSRRNHFETSSAHDEAQTTMMMVTSEGQTLSDVVESLAPTLYLPNGS